jgi:hypothetical protein
VVVVVVVPATFALRGGGGAATVVVVVVHAAQEEGIWRFAVRYDANLLLEQHGFAIIKVFVHIQTKHEAHMHMHLSCTCTTKVHKLQAWSFSLQLNQKISREITPADKRTFCQFRDTEYRQGHITCPWGIHSPPKTTTTIPVP